jgi:hypothetical protein
MGALDASTMLLAVLFIQVRKTVDQQAESTLNGIDSQERGDAPQP